MYLIDILTNLESETRDYSVIDQCELSTSKLSDIIKSANLMISPKFNQEKVGRILLPSFDFNSELRKIDTIGPLSQFIKLLNKYGIYFTYGKTDRSFYESNVDKFIVNCNNELIKTGSIGIHITFRWDLKSNVMDTKKFDKIDYYLYHYTKPSLKDKILNEGLIPQKVTNFDTYYAAPLIHLFSGFHQSYILTSGNKLWAFNEEVIMFEVDLRNTDHKLFIDPNKADEALITVDPIKPDNIRLMTNDESVKLVRSKLKAPYANKI